MQKTQKSISGYSSNQLFMANSDHSSLKCAKHSFICHNSDPSCRKIPVEDWTHAGLLQSLHCKAGTSYHKSLYQFIQGSRYVEYVSFWTSRIRIFKKAGLRIRIRDLVLFWHMDPGRKKLDLWSVIWEELDLIFENLV